jgi:hypothetical protein
VTRRDFIKQSIAATGTAFILPHLAIARAVQEAMSNSNSSNSKVPGYSQPSSPSTTIRSNGDKISSLGFSCALVSRNFWNASSFQGNAYFEHNTSSHSLSFISAVTDAVLKSPGAATIGYPSIYYGRFGPGNATSGEATWLPMPMTLSNFASMDVVSVVSYFVRNPGGMPFNLFYDLWCGSHELAISMYSFNRPPYGTEIGTITLSEGSIWTVYKVPSQTTGYTNFVIRPRNAAQPKGTSSINLSEMLQSKVLALRPSSSLIGLGFGGEYLPIGSSLQWESTGWTLSNKSRSLKVF